MMIDILRPVKDIILTDDILSGLNEKDIKLLYKAAGTMSIKSFCNTWSTISLNNDMHINEDIVRKITKQLENYGLDLGMPIRQLDLYQSKARQQFGTIMDKTMNLKSHKSAQMEKVEKKHISIPVNNQYDDIWEERRWELVCGFLFDNKLQPEQAVRNANTVITLMKGQQVVIQKRTYKHPSSKKGLFESLENEFSAKDISKLMDSLGYAGNSYATYVAQWVKEGKLIRIARGRFRKL